jgi:hypothetical protein
MITLHLSHKKIEKCGLKKYVKVALKSKLENKTSSNEKINNEVH